MSALAGRRLSAALMSALAGRRLSAALMSALAGGCLAAAIDNTTGVVTLYSTFLGRTATIVRLRSHVLDHHDLDAVVG
jgi:hypothetical protein